MTDPEISNVVDSTILLGDDADRFFESDLGQYVMARAREQMSEALNKLAIVEPASKEYWDARMMYHIARSVPMWLNDAITCGKQLLAMKMDDEINNII